MAMSSLPEEIQDEIFMKLPSNSIRIGRHVCKKWYAVLSDPKIVDNPIHKLPPKVMIAIFGRLSCDTVERCYCVCKNWHNLIRNEWSKFHPYARVKEG